MNTRSTTRYLLAATAALLVSTTSALAGTVGGSVTAINQLATPTFANAIVIGSSTPAANGQTDTIIVSSVIDNNNDAGWKLTVTSTGLGILKKGAGGAGRQITYTNVKLVKTGGTLGASLIDPSGTSKNIATGAGAGAVAGTTAFNTGASFGAPGTATTATEAYAFDLKITWASDTTVLAGTYSDTITLVLANDS